MWCQSCNVTQYFINNSDLVLKKHFLLSVLYCLIFLRNPNIVCVYTEAFIWNRSIECILAEYIFFFKLYPKPMKKIIKQFQQRQFTKRMVILRISVFRFQYKLSFFLFLFYLTATAIHASVMQIHISVMWLLSFGKWRNFRHIVWGVASDGLVWQECVCLGRFCLCTSQHKEQVIFHTK